ncbi:MAG: multidrug effflux MFS transporter [Alphaproteobacteria bacterium]|nr:multidrug effflux MFS transporter [Alphaproteobacteria bacterium]
MVFFTVIICLFLAGMEIDLFIPSFPELIRVFDLTPFLVQLTLSVNFLSYCISSLYVGNLGDRYGRRPVILLGICVFVLGSILCVIADAFWILVLGRFLQGIGMAGPAVLSYVIISDITPIEKQAGLLGTMNGIVTMAMASAPIIGSFVNMYFSWRGNFYVLLGLGVIALVFAYFFIPHTKKADKTVDLSLRSYIPLFKSRRYMALFSIICFLITCYYTFIGLGPILYMEDMGVPLHQFGFYQGAILVTFSIMSLSSPAILARISHSTCFRVGSVMCMSLAMMILLIGVGVPDTPWIITLTMSLYVMAFVFPVNILYPLALDAMPEAKGKAAALINFGRLAFSAIGIELVSYFYTGAFCYLAIFIFVLTLVSFLLIRRTQEWKSGER